MTEKDENSSLLLKVLPFKAQDVFKAHKLISDIYKIEFKVDITRDLQDDFLIKVSLRESSELLASRFFYKGTQIGFQPFIEDKPQTDVYNFVSLKKIYQDLKRLYFIPTQLKSLKALTKAFTNKHGAVYKSKTHLIPGIQINSFIATSKQTYQLFSKNSVFKCKHGTMNFVKVEDQWVQVLKDFENSKEILLAKKSFCWFSKEINDSQKARKVLEGYKVDKIIESHLKTSNIMLNIENEASQRLRRLQNEFLRKKQISLSRDDLDREPSMIKYSFLKKTVSKCD